MAKNKKNSASKTKFTEAVDSFIKENPEMIKDFLESFNKVADKEYQIEKVTEKDWNLTHPMQTKCGGDKFYADLSNKIQDELAKINFQANLPDYTLLECAMAFSAYLEDLVSETGVWNAVRNLYKEKYGQWMPFFDTSHSEYYTDDLNIEDLKVLTWQVFNRLGQLNETTFSPLSGAISKIAEIGYDILIDSFDKAPKATRIKDLINKVFRKKGYFALRTLGLWINVDNKLTATPYLREEMANEAEQFMNIHFQNEINISQAYYYCEAAKGWLENISMLGCPTSVILERMARDYGFEDTANLLATIKTLPPVIYKLNRIEKDSLVFVDRTGTEFPVDKTSLRNSVDTSKIKGGTMNLVRFGELWQQNGIAVFSSEEFEWKDTDDAVGDIRALTDNLESVIIKNKGRQVFYCKNVKEVSKIMDMLIPVANDPSQEAPDNLLLMVSKETMPVLIPDSCELFSDKSNPFYDGSDDREWLGEESFNLIARGVIPDDVAEYIQQKKLLPHAFIYASQGKRVGKRIVQDNLRFFCGFYRVLPAKVDYDDCENESDEY